MVFMKCIDYVQKCNVIHNQTNYILNIDYLIDKYQ